MKRWAWIAVLVVVILFLGAAAGCLLRPPSQGAEPTSIANQIYVSEVSSTVLQVLSSEKVASQPLKGDLVEFKSGVSLSTAETGYGHVELGFPGQVDIYLASGTETMLRDSADERVSIEILLTRGWLLARLPQTFSATSRVVVDSPEGAQAWASGSAVGAQFSSSILGAQYLSVTHELYVDCLKGQCGYTDSLGNHILPEGSHVSLNGKTVLSTGPGTRSELWQFVPSMVEAPTLIPSVTPNVAETQSCRYFLSLGLTCEGGFPTATITPTPTLTPTPNWAATQQCIHDQRLGTPCP